MINQELRYAVEAENKKVVEPFIDGLLDQFAVIGFNPAQPLDGFYDPRNWNLDIELRHTVFEKTKTDPKNNIWISFNLKNGYFELNVHERNTKDAQLIIDILTVCSEHFTECGNKSEVAACLKRGLTAEELFKFSIDYQIPELPARVAEHTAWIAHKTAASAELNNMLNLPELVGTTKQISWANDLRIKVLAYATSEQTDRIIAGKFKVAALKAKFWIDMLNKNHGNINSKTAPTILNEALKK